MKKVLALVAFLVVSPVFAGEIVTVGEGSVSTTPDVAYISVSVITDDTSPNTALSNNNRKVQRVFSALSRLGLKKEEIASTRLDLQPQYKAKNNQERDYELVGYKVIHSIQITVCDLDDTGKIIDNVIKEGATSIDNVEFSLSTAKMKKALDEARIKAAQDATHKSSLFARALNTKITKLKTMSENRDYRPRREQAYSRDVRPLANTNVESGSLTVSVTISATWECE